MASINIAVEPAETATLICEGSLIRHFPFETRLGRLSGKFGLGNFVSASDGTWKGGRIYNPDDGKEYNVLISIQDDGKLRARVYTFMRIFGKTLVWTRVK